MIKYFGNQLEEE